jgi:hypothetical protein
MIAKLKGKLSYETHKGTNTYYCDAPGAPRFSCQVPVLSTDTTVRVTGKIVSGDRIYPVYLGLHRNRDTKNHKTEQRGDIYAYFSVTKGKPGLYDQKYSHGYDFYLGKRGRILRSGTPKLPEMYLEVVRSMIKGGFPKLLKLG